MSTAGNPLRAGSGGFAGVLNIGHRGGRAFAPENTLAAFENAARLGCDMIEIDVHKSLDGELVVHHDDTLERCTNVGDVFAKSGRRYISDFTYAELASLDAGSWYVRELRRRPRNRQSFLQSITPAELERCVSDQDKRRYASGEVGIPTLKQTLELVRSTGMMINIEIKSIPRLYSSITRAVVTMVQDFDLEHRTLISSFDHEQLLIARELNRVIATGVLTSDRIAKPVEYLRLLDADAYHPGCYGDYDSLGFGSVSGELDARGIEAVRAAGHHVNVWTCNDVFEMKKLIGAGVTGIVTDYPNRVNRLKAAANAPKSEDRP